MEDRIINSTLSFQKVFSLPSNAYRELSNEESIEKQTQKELFEVFETIGKLQQKIHVLDSSEELKQKSERKKLNEEIAYSEFKSDDKRKDSIRSVIQDYLSNNNRLRVWAIWTIGVNLEIRISYLLSLKIKYLLNNDKIFSKRLYVVEQKTSKLFDYLNWNLQLDDYLFKSNKTKGKMFKEYGGKILSDADKNIQLLIIIGSHMMRKSFTSIVACVDKYSIDMNAITKIQGLLNKSDQRVTMKYPSSYQQMFVRA